MYMVILVHGVLSDHSLCTVFTPSDNHLEHTLLSVHCVYKMHSVCVLCNWYTDLVVFGAPGDHHSHGVHAGQYSVHSVYTFL